MKLLSKKIYIILFTIPLLMLESNLYAKGDENKYKRRNISNYFLGIIYANQDYSEKAYGHLKKVKALKNKHYQFNIKYIRTLVLLEKFDEAFSFSEKIWKKDELFFEADLLIGLNFFLKKDYANAEKHFERLNKISRYNIFSDNFIGNILIAWSKALQNNKNESLQFLEQVPKAYYNLTRTQNIFLQCHFDNNNTKNLFEELIRDKDYNFSRYNFFLANYLFYKNREKDAKKLIENARKEYNANLLIKQTENFISNNEAEKIKFFFNCKNAKDSLAELFYVIANLYSGEKEYEMSNFYLKISLYLNNKFLSNQALLAENFYYQKKYENAQKIYQSVKLIGPVYSWHASKNIAKILYYTKGKNYSISSLEKQFNLISDPSYEHYYELANFYKDNEFFEESVKYYSLTLKKIKKDHFLVPKILDRRGTSFERMGNWEKAEKDLIESLKILPDQAHVLNYLGYSWIDKKIKIDEGLEMIKKASEIKENDGYIIDSLGWGYYAKKNYIQAEYFLQKAVELLPSDPVINDHYADVLWMLNKNIQARYTWNYILKLDRTEQKLKDSISKKLIFGIDKQL